MTGTNTGDIDTIIDTALEQRIFPGLVCGIWKNGQLRYSRCSGFRTLEPQPEMMKTDTLFDLASLTKPLSTALLLMRIKEREGFDLSEELGEFLPELPAETAKRSLFELLTHTAGVVDAPKLQRCFPDSEKVDPVAARRLLLKTVPVEPAGKEVLYSCTGYLLIGAALERLCGKSLKELFAEEIAEPLGLSDRAGFVPPAALRSQAAATEFCAWRSRRMQGQVHDESSYCLGGIAGNAGLFAPIEDVAKIVAVYMPGAVNGDSPLAAGAMKKNGSKSGAVGNVPLLSPESVRIMTSSQTEGMNRRRAIGWAMHDAETLDGPDWPDDAFGHTGFTGTSVFAVPRMGLVCIVLTNRVYFGREPTAEPMGAFRRAFHSAAIKAFGS